MKEFVPSWHTPEPTQPLDAPYLTLLSINNNFLTYDSITREP